jgi:hypothetical protein
LRDVRRARLEVGLQGRAPIVLSAVVTREYTERFVAEP